MRKMLAVLVVVALVVLGWFAVRNGWFDDLVPTSAPAPAGPSGTGSSSSGIPADATAAVVEYVHDGDTLFLEDGRKVRMLGINTPEIGDNLECFGDEATALTRSLLPEGAHVWVQEDVEPLDQYGRSLLFVYTDDGTNVNLELLSEGAAEVEMYTPNVLLSDEVHAAEERARNAGLGLWSVCR
ncbi:MAG: thermonuclease [Rhodoglobus sp.]|nr:thermonuclease [Rhodoglobus sp.]